uniref:hypothetical protein n=1 Tax=Algoriphagus sp. TaxID=1872435 RepID=UPI004048B1BD
MDCSAAGGPVAIGQLAGQAIHPNQGGGCRKKPKNPPDLRQSHFPHHQKKCFPVGDLSRILVVLPNLS